MKLETIQENLNVTAYSQEYYNTPHTTGNTTGTITAVSKKYAVFIKLLLSSYAVIVLLTVAIFVITYKLVQEWTYRLD